MKSIRLFHRRFNYSSKSVDRGKCRKSLNHSLRLVIDQKKTFEWDSKLSMHNLVWSENQTRKLDDLTDSQKESLLYKIMPPAALKNKKQLQTQRVNFKSKMKKAVQTLQEKGLTDAAVAFKCILDVAERGRVPDELVRNADSYDYPRKKQRMTMVNGFVKAHNKLCNDQPSANNVWVQEGIIKIPSQWEVGTDVISLQEYIEHTKEFLHSHFPDFEIQAILGHDDERLENESTGAHVHYFLSGKNSKTGEYNLRKKQFELVNQYIAKHGNPDDLLPLPLKPREKLTRQHTQVFGSYFQKMIYRYLNTQLLNPRGLNADFSDEAERHSEQRQKMNREAKLSKQMRSHNFHSRSIEILEAKAAMLEKELISLNNQLNEKKRARARLYSEIEKSTSQKILLGNELETLRAERDELQHTSNALSEDVIKKLSDLYKNIRIASVAKHRGNNATETRYLELVSNSLNKLAPKSIRTMVCQHIKEMNEQPAKTSTRAPDSR